MTGTQFCDLAGLRELVWAHKRAVADGGGLRLVMAGDGAVMRIFTVIRPHQSRHQRLPERDQPATVPPGALVRRRTVPGGVINNYHRAA